MIRQPTQLLADLYMADETAWLDAMAELISQRRLDDLDLVHLQEYLEDTAKRDRREVLSRLTILITHVLKWVHQPDHRTKSWRRTAIVQRHELTHLLESGTLRNHAEAILAEAYANAIEEAVAETGLDENAFHAECPWTLEQLLSPEVLAE
jgi:hypothetical protein